MPPKETSSVESQRKGGLEGSRTEPHCTSPRHVPSGPQGNGPPHSWSHLLLAKTELHWSSSSSVEQCSLHSWDAGWGWGTVCKSGWDSTEPQASGLIHILLNHKHRSGFPGKIWMSNRNTQNRCGFSTAEVGAVLRYTSLGYFSFKVFKKKFFLNDWTRVCFPEKGC